VHNFYQYHRVQNGSGAHPASYPMGTRGSLSASWSGLVSLLLGLHGASISALKMEASGPSETKSYHTTTWRRNPVHIAVNISGLSLNWLVDCVVVNLVVRMQLTGEGGV